MASPLEKASVAVARAGRRTDPLPSFRDAMKNRSGILLGTLAALVLGVQAAAAAEPDAALKSLLRAPALRGARLGVVVISLQTGETVLERSSERLMIPASNQKILLAATALAHWGPAKRFETPVLTDGSIAENGVLEGTLWIQGLGDPSLVSESLWKLAEEIRLLGITQVRDGIAVDASYFDGMRFHPDWEPLSSRAYHAPTSAFAANYSSCRIEVTPASKVGKPARVSVAPFTPYFRVRSDVLTGAKAGPLQLELDSLPDGSGDRVRMRGLIAQGAKPKTYWRAISLPEHYAANLLRTQLETQGVRVSGPIRVGRVPPSARELLRFQGEPLDQIIRKLNKFSNNFIAAQLIKGLGAEVHGAPGSWRKGIRVVEAHLRGIGINGAQAILADGSGLSPRNRVSAETLARVVRDATLRFDSGPEFLASLPLGGLDGTLEDRMNGSETSVRGKTGHLRHVSSLSGLLPRGGEWLVFSILVNGARGSSTDVDAAIDAFIAELAATGDGDSSVLTR